MRTRRKRARKRGQPMPPSRRVNVLYPYFALCLFSAAAHSAQDNSFYYGLCILVSWALWPERSRRFALPVWLGVLTIAVVVGFLDSVVSASYHGWQKNMILKFFPS